MRNWSLWDNKLFKDNLSAEQNGFRKGLSHFYLAFLSQGTKAAFQLISLALSSCVSTFER
jgi:hypothetical protein